ncbi:MAG: SDR family NAD(P)-dependent oxidoreductase, partial [Actinobacteria bacterium]|nr:SDR family NAD(P)-dependent oxidoreductase [Actinomycetota bacterium]
MADVEGFNPFSVAGCRAVIVGGTAGIGLAVANHMVAAGASIVVTGRRGGEPLATPTGMSSVAMDVADGESVKSGFAAIDEIIDGIDCLILNAGIDAETGL